MQDFTKSMELMSEGCLNRMAKQNWEEPLKIEAEDKDDDAWASSREND